MEDHLSKKERKKYDKYRIDFDRRVERLDKEMGLLIQCKTLWEVAEKLIQSGDQIKMRAGKKVQTELVPKGIVMLLPRYIEEEMKKAISEG